jgi:hypothetical protein
MTRSSDLPVLPLAFLAACAVSVTALAAGNPGLPDSIAAPLVTQNPDGTITVQKELPKAHAEDAQGKAGLSIPPQVIVPVVPSVGKRDTAANKKAGK